jgi:hypothetical protein
MNCPSCGAHAHPAWEFCRRCGADLPGEGQAQREAQREGLRQRLGLPHVRAFALLRVPRMPLVARPSLPRVARDLPRRTSAPVVVLAAALLATVLVAGLLAIEVAGTRSDLAGVRAEQAAQDGEVEQLRDEVAESRQAEAALRQELAARRAELDRTVRERDEARAEAGAGERTSSEARGALEAAQARLGALERASQTQAQQIQSLTECLSGYRVALEFARDGSWRSAELAIDAVSVSCQEVSEAFR